MLVEPRALHVSHRSEDPRHPVEIECYLGYSLIGRKARVVLQADAQGNVDHQVFTNALRGLAQAIDNDCAKMAGQQGPSLLIPENIAKEVKSADQR